jgi:hypothetical protein
LRKKEPLGHTPPPPWYGWTIKLGLAAALLLAAISQFTIVLYLAPAVRNLSEDDATQKKQSACYDRYTAGVTDGSAGVVVSIGSLVVELASSPRDQAAVDASIARIDSFSKKYIRAIAARSQYVVDGRPLPCPLPD